MEPGLLRFTTAGSVDDGKSTLIGRLLYDTRSVYEDQIESAHKASRHGLELAFLTDGLRAEREQGITIDVAYRFFSTARRRFILADTPGHEQYTRNMVTAASTADVAVVLVDARKGVLPQTKRHACIAWLFGIQYLVVAVNKMDIVEYSREIFDRIRADFLTFSAKLVGCQVEFIPVSALEGENVVCRSRRMPWFEGCSLLEYLESAPTAEFAAQLCPPGHNSGLPAFRLPVQYVIREGEFRGYAGRIASGSVRRGDELQIQPSGQTTRVSSISTYDGNLERASAPMSVALTLQDQLDIGRGSMLADPANPPLAAQRLTATLVWMSESPLDPQRPYLMKLATQHMCAAVTGVLSRLDIHTLEEVPAASLALNEIGIVELETHRPLFCDLYDRNHATGGFILIDPIDNQTMAAGMIRSVADPRGLRLQTTGGSRNGLTVWFTGLSSSGKTTLSGAIYERLWAMGYKLELLDGDVVRRNLSRELGFSREDRDENIRRIGFVAELLTRNGVIVLVSAISPYRAMRDEIRARIGNFVEVYVNAPLAVCEQRDVKGLYRRARGGKLSSLTGIDDPYEPPARPEVECQTDRENLAESTDKVLKAIACCLAVRPDQAAKWQDVLGFNLRHQSP